ncbi:Mud1p KNAG_0B01400 [Huiozyma naganishii CBS 8797]|uniref:RRM domain-containing protein n=1 Tax=Huiozyma naganishii (strain ATCC MYA-139 / BCRC 22969 / CBS 8797 / KCTC 17520 / NBRC 10181 / NCYC 3082 / Yp74L-3) TaxID=1071383 RepID=J7RUQ9_HUIN7|nr:hypothetical protein KNAG_0B01400 [Kazachstania naganishii CBS 8797]CCK68587.1 hypothetical protein KNAG_0B01400 [Kazachstania naganishii CBS 8797]
MLFDMGTRVHFALLFHVLDLDRCISTRYIPSLQMGTTLYLRNLPTRPHNRANYIRSFLSAINPTNRYVHDTTLLLPIHQISGTQAVPGPFLDETHRILSIARSNSGSMAGQCFVTFVDEHSAEQFMNAFQGMNFRGKRVEIRWAEQESLLGLALTQPERFKKVMRIKKLTMEEIVQNKVKRKLRRLRYKLRRKGLDPAQIEDIVAKVRVDVVDDEEVEETEGNATGMETVVQPTPKSNTTTSSTTKKVPKGIVDVTANPPAKLLLVQQLPETTTETQLRDVFDGPDLVDIRMVAIRRLAFVEYTSIESATAALQKTGTTFKMDAHDIVVGYAKS